MSCLLSTVHRDDNDSNVISDKEYHVIAIVIDTHHKASVFLHKFLNNIRLSTGSQMGCNRFGINCSAAWGMDLICSFVYMDAP